MLKCGAEHGSGEIIIYGISARAIPGRRWSLSMDLELTGGCMILVSEIDIMQGLT